MELYVQLILTVFVSLIFTSFFFKLVSMQPINQLQIQNSNPCPHLRTRESSRSGYAINTNKFEAIPYTDEVIKLQECPFEGRAKLSECPLKAARPDHSTERALGWVERANRTYPVASCILLDQAARPSEPLLWSSGPSDVPRMLFLALQVLWSYFIAINS
ncbi:uncharacterized protein LOC130809318 isoform X1 [Amaranthus tricolor]|uniref:uncharacterized protein LOC130809318 isoform X1 n=1 Tax=Amaranthus tricolor TaxID=29722 RepID=UPI002589AC69|nr:uncharacterized protein LOC130809318 isoform X1 [Amaranthus tricolor]